MSTAPVPVLEVRGLKVGFHTGQGYVRAVDGASFHVDPGDPRRIRLRQERVGGGDHEHNHLKISTDSVAMFNASQDFIEVEVDANMAAMESRKKLVVAYAAGAAPDRLMTVQYWLQDDHDNGILEPLGDRLNAWEFIKVITTGDAAMLYTANRAVPPVRHALAFLDGQPNRTQGLSAFQEK